MMCHFTFLVKVEEDFVVFVSKSRYFKVQIRNLRFLESLSEAKGAIFYFLLFCFALLYFSSLYLRDLIFLWSGRSPRCLYVLFNCASLYFTSHCNYFYLHFCNGAPPRRVNQ
jgi:hypothetical protein